MSCSNFPANYDLVIYIGQSFIQNITWNAAGYPVNLTTYTATFNVTYGSSNVISLTSSSGITLGSNGTIYIQLLDTTALTPANASYELILIDSSTGIRTCLLNGFCTIQKGI